MLVIVVAKTDESAVGSFKNKHLFQSRERTI